VLVLTTEALVRSHDREQRPWRGPTWPWPRDPARSGRRRPLGGALWWVPSSAGGSPSGPPASRRRSWSPPVPPSERPAHPRPCRPMAVGVLVGVRGRQRRNCHAPPHGGRRRRRW